MTNDMRINRLLFGIIMAIAVALVGAKAIVGHTIKPQADRALAVEHERGGAQPGGR